LCEKFFDYNIEINRVIVFDFSSMDTTLRSIIRASRPYFGPNATQEMLDEWRPLMCPLDVSMGKAMIYLVKKLDF
jgi:hypothetical protein